MNRRGWVSVDVVEEWPFQLVPLAGRDVVVPDRVTLVGRHTSGATVRVEVRVVDGRPRPVDFRVSSDNGERIRHAELRRWADAIEELARFAVVESASRTEPAGVDRVRRVRLSAAHRAELERQLRNGRRPRSTAGERYAEVRRIVEEAERDGVDAGPRIAAALDVTPEYARQIKRRAMSAKTNGGKR
mgnify:CR=1 FL=1